MTPRIVPKQRQNKGKKQGRTCLVCGKECKGLVCKDCVDETMEAFYREEELSRTE